MKKLPSSYRDPSGYMFVKDGELFRFVDNCYRRNYDLLNETGLYDGLISKKYLIPHEEVDLDTGMDSQYKVLKPLRVDFISYPYEWCFSQLKDAALLTLKIQKKALKKGMSLKDATPYNVQFHKGKPIFIDTLSFEKYSEGKPWIAYKQFCESFLAPLILMAKVDIRLNQLLRIFLDGIPLELVSKLLPKRSKLSPSLFIHIFMHSRSQKKHEDNYDFNANNVRKVSRYSLDAMLDSLYSVIRKIKLKDIKTEWGNYYDSNNNYSDESLEYKKKILGKYIDMIKPKKVWDLGANTGFFSKVAVDKGAWTLAMDIDPMAVEMGYRSQKNSESINMLSLCLDVSNPSPSLGFANKERSSFLERGPVDLVMALALIHHLAISNNLSLKMLAEFFSDIAENLVIEFVPKDDSQVQKLLTSREDIFSDYSEEEFEKEFSKYFKIDSKEKIMNSKRYLYMMVRN